MKIYSEMAAMIKLVFKVTKIHKYPYYAQWFGGKHEHNEEINGW